MNTKNQHILGAEGGVMDRVDNAHAFENAIEELERAAIASALSQQPEANVAGELSHADLCRLFSVFNDHNELHLPQDQRISEWLIKRIAALTGERNG